MQLANDKKCLSLEIFFFFHVAMDRDFNVVGSIFFSFLFPLQRIRIERYLFAVPTHSYTYKYYKDNRMTVPGVL